MKNTVRIDMLLQKETKDDLEMLAKHQKCTMATLIREGIGMLLQKNERALADAKYSAEVNAEFMRIKDL